jgi:hydro-lyases, Fe-S type, tartrate/fumarate subfamily, beta region
MAEHHLHSPFDMDFSNVNIGDKVLISGYIYTARDAAHKRLYNLINEGKALPFDIKNQAIYYTGPCPAKPGHPIGPCGPTTSGRVDIYTPSLLNLGLKIMIGKGFRSREVIDSMIKNKCLYLACVGGAGALLSKCVKEVSVVAFPDLGTEAVHRLYVENFPTIAAIDIRGNNLYTEGAKKYRID